MTGPEAVVLILWALGAPITHALIQVLVPDYPENARVLAIAAWPALSLIYLGIVLGKKTTP